MSSGGGSSSSFAEDNIRVRELAERLGMDPDDWSDKKNREIDNLLNRLGLEGRDDLANDSNNHIAQMKAEKLGQWAKDTNVNLNDVSLTESFGKWQKTLDLNDEDRIVGTDVDGDGITDPIDVDPDTEGFQYDDPRWAGDPDAAKLTVSQALQAEQQEGTPKLDLTEDKVSELTSQSFGITRESYGTDEEYTKAVTDIASSIETQFIDELYGSDEANIATVDFHGEGTGALFGGERGSFGGTGIDPLYGLDLARTMKDENGDPIEYNKNAATGSAQNQVFYEALTRGKVDWAHYYNDNTYRRVFKHLELDIKDLSASKLSPGQRVELIRAADAYILNEDAAKAIKDKDSSKKALPNPKFFSTAAYAKIVAANEKAADKKSGKWKDADGVREGELEGFKIKPGEKMYVGLDHKLEGATEDTFQLYIDGERKVTMGEKLSIPPGETLEVNVAPPGSDPIYKTIKSAYQNITSPSDEEIEAGGTFTIGGDIDPTTGRARPSKTISVDTVKKGLNWDFLDTPITLGGRVSWHTRPDGRRIPTLVKPLAKQSLSDGSKSTDIPSIPKGQTKLVSRDMSTTTKPSTNNKNSIQQGGKK